MEMTKQQKFNLMPWAWICAGAACLVASLVLKHHHQRADVWLDLVATGPILLVVTWKLMSMGKQFKGVFPLWLRIAVFAGFGLNPLWMLLDVIRLIAVKN